MSYGVTMEFYDWAAGRQLSAAIWFDSTLNAALTQMFSRLQDERVESVCTCALKLVL